MPPPSLPQKAFSLLLDALFPPRCGGCERFCDQLFCSRCAPLAQSLNAPLCRICGTPFGPNTLPAPECADCRANRYHTAPAYAAARSAFSFEGPVRNAVHRFKYGGKTWLAQPLAERLDQLMRTDPVLSAASPALIVPVPLHSWRRWRRGFNQAELLAKPLASWRGLPLARLLVRTRLAPAQVGLNKAQRAANVRGIYAVDARRFELAGAKGAAVLLVDDVYTTGATIAECARLLRAAGSGPVYAVTVGRRP